MDTLVNLIPNQTVIAVVGILLIIAFIRLFFSPLRFAVKALINTAGGFFWLFVINTLGASHGVELGFNIFNAIIIAIFGIPGVVFLLISKWILM